MTAARAPQEIAAALDATLGTTIRGKADGVALALTALLGGGHLLVQDLPGTGKTLLAKSMAAALGGHFGRVQCTPDLLPSDISGTSVFQPQQGTWQFRPGPLFANVLLVDEINRASPRTQSALLEPMEERQVSVDGVTHRLPDPFFCIATQNPSGQLGTFPLPESQLDRFALTVSLGLPGRDAEREIVRGQGGVDRLPAIVPVTSPAELAATIDAVHRLHCADAVVEYVLDLVALTRTDPELSIGVSPRVSSSLLAMARARAVVVGRDYVTPDDVQFVFQPACAHRVSLHHGVDVVAAWTVLGAILGRVPVPRG
ncbi:MAG: MoxR family ATPase [Acidimicrobiales bacterium]